MRIFLALVFWICCAPVGAEVVSIRSGEHDRFSRLVLTIPEGREWTLGRVSDGYALELGDGSDTYDTTTVFDRIPPDRIASIESEDGRLRISVSCECHADAFLWRADKLVVDVVDGPPPDGSEFEIALVGGSTEEPQSNSADQVNLPLLIEAPDAGARPPLVPGTFAVTPPTDNRVAEAERAVIESLARAASQGVFDIPSRPVPIIPDNLSEDGSANSAELPVLTPITDPMDGIPTPVSNSSGTGGPGLVLRTGIERDENGKQGIIEESGHCISDEMLGLDTWGDDRDFSTQIADHRRILTGEFDAYPEGSIEDLAKTYIFFGFGQEARQVLALDGQGSQERLVLDALSRVVDDVPQRNGVLDDQMDCSGFVVMWAALANGSLGESSTDGRNAAVMAFRLLPDQLRGHLGARLARLFLEAGDSTTADMILTASQRLETGHTVEADLTGAAVIESTEGAGPAIEVLGAMADEDTRMTADGLVQLINLLLAEGRTVDDPLLDLASAMRFEAGGSDDARKLGLAELRARTARDEFDAALVLVSDVSLPIAQVDRDAQTSQVVAEMAERGDTASFLEFAFADLPNGLSAEAENAVAKRLLEVGFPDRAMSILAGPAVQEAMAERRYLRGEAAAEIGDIDALNAALIGLSDPRAAQIRARALAASGDFQSALAEELQQPDAVASPEGAWRAGAWTLLESGDDPLLQTASRAILSDPVVLPSPPTLESRRDLIEEAQATRTMTEELLDRFNIDADQVSVE
ncbi:hypothetical protein [Flavimaricola marinus]|uniref:Uncharacterized protein n=1 Tax=Flavimaricola marinus TaxID=1819565 RepID=A0A238LFN6_9RHOB|nr:hypothetical protein [Flavimaricola marinus]SMY08224.1 hypothetical protein LOM8899_02374 [Flavimaricola marinus]